MGIVGVIFLIVSLLFGIPGIVVAHQLGSEGGQTCCKDNSVLGDPAKLYKANFVLAILNGIMLIVSFAMRGMMGGIIHLILLILCAVGTGMLNQKKQEWLEVPSEKATEVV